MDLLPAGLLPLGLSNVGLIVAISFLAIGLWEHVAPERRAAAPAGPRWFANFALYAMSIGVAALAGAVLGDAAAAMVPRLPLETLGPVAHMAVVVVVLDLAHYWLHRLYHAGLWRLHAVHHTDPDPDVSTALRHHPAEMIPAVALTVLMAGLLGASASEVAAYSSLAFAVQVLAHANVALPRALASALQAVVVTPGFHRLHHSRDERECHANYGEVFTVWDRLFGTAVAPTGVAPAAYGVTAYLAPRFQSLGTILIQPVLAAEAPAASPPRDPPADAPRALPPRRRGAAAGRAAALRGFGRRRHADRR